MPWWVPPPNTHGLCEWVTWTDQLPRGVRWFGATPWGPQFIDLRDFTCSVVLLDKSKRLILWWVPKIMITTARFITMSLSYAIKMCQNSEPFQDSPSLRPLRPKKAQEPPKCCSSPLCQQLSSLLGSKVCDKSMMGQPMSRPDWMMQAAYEVCQKCIHKISHVR